MIGIEQYAFAILCEDLVRQKQGNIPHTNEFREYCAKHLKHEDVNLRPSLQAVLLHPYFTHDFIQIHSYLVELPLKSPESKQEFFSTLLDRLRCFDEQITASQLAGLLLSRLVLLDITAKACFTPFLLKPKAIDEISELESTIHGLFSPKVFQKYLIPKIKQAFAIKDAQIRIALLEYFPSYVEMFNRDDLKHEILPQLLLGIKDTNDFLVSRTLLCMADLIPILGATQVIGGNRTKIFSDGRPQGPETQLVKSTTEPRSITPVITSAEHLLTESPIPEPIDVSGSFTLNGVSEENDADVSSNLDPIVDAMPERLTPEGEEMEVPTASEIEPEDWSDWENQDGHIPNSTIDNPTTVSPIHSLSVVENTEQNIPPLQADQSKQTETKNSTVRAIVKSDDIDELDIKNKTFKKLEEPEEFDFFKDMVPVIQKANTMLVGKEPQPTQEPLVTKNLENRVSSNRLSLSSTDVIENGWGENEDAWGE